MATKRPTAPQLFIGFRMQTIQVTQFAMNLPIDGTPLGTKLAFEITPRVGKHNTDRSLGGVELGVRALRVDNDQEAYSIRAFFDFVFEGNLTGEDVRDQERVQKTLIGMSFSTLRGILYEKLAGTPYAAQLLITVDTNSFVLPGKEMSKPRRTVPGRKGGG
jgi:hypothetical protein